MNLKVGPAVDVGRCIIEVSDFQTSHVVRPNQACHHGAPFIGKAEGSQNAECDGAQFENQVRYSTSLGKLGKLGVFPPPPKKGVQGSQNFLKKTCKKSQRKRQMRTGTKKTPAKPIGPNCWVFSLNFEICINKNPLLHSKKGL